MIVRSWDASGWDTSRRDSAEPSWKGWYFVQSLTYHLLRWLSQRAPAWLIKVQFPDPWRPQIPSCRLEEQLIRRQPAAFQLMPPFISADRGGRKLWYAALLNGGYSQLYGNIPSRPRPDRISMPIQQ